MALFILCSKFHLKSARNKDPWHWAFHGIVYCPIMYLDKQKGTLITLAEEVLNVPIWPEETGDCTPRMCWLERETSLSLLTAAHVLPTTACALASGAPLPEDRRAQDVGGSKRMLQGISDCSIPSTHGWSQGFKIQTLGFCSESWVAVIQGCRNRSASCAGCSVPDLQSQTKSHICYWSVLPSSSFLPSLPPSR